MPRVAKGVNKIAVALHDWDEDDRQEAIDFALHPGNGTTAIMLYLRQRDIYCITNNGTRLEKNSN